MRGRILQDDDKPSDLPDDGNMLGESDDGYPELDEKSHQNQSNDFGYEDAEIDSKLQEKDAELNLQTHRSMELNQKQNVEDVNEMASSVQVGDASNKKHILHAASQSHGSSNTETETEEEWEI